MALIFTARQTLLNCLPNGRALYVYNEKILRQRCRDLVSLSDHSGFRVNYSVKANSNPVLLAIIRSEGLMADAMSPGELYMNELAGYEPANTLYIANNITADEMAAAWPKAALQASIPWPSWIFLAA